MAGSKSSVYSHLKFLGFEAFVDTSRVRCDDSALLCVNLDVATSQSSVSFFGKVSENVGMGTQIWIDTDIFYHCFLTTISSRPGMSPYCSLLMLWLSYMSDSD